VLYRLESAILHYGATTSSGHFVCIRRKPTKHGKEATRHRPQTVYKSCPDGCRCQQCVYFGQVRGQPSVPGKGWLSISDDDIEEVGEEALAGARPAVFMLFYERIGEYVEVPKNEGVMEKVELSAGNEGSNDVDVKSKL
jgi:ubiquitin carboxyl-terminal hydrolase 1